MQILTKTAEVQARITRMQRYTRRVEQHTCVGCGAYIRHPGNRWRDKNPDHMALPVCSDCNPSLHDRQEGKNRKLRSRESEENWYNQNQWDNWVKVYEESEV